MKNLVSKTILATAFAALAILPLSAENSLIARGERGGGEHFEGEERIQHQNMQHYDNRNINHYDNRNNQRNWNNVDRREWNNYQDRQLENQLENDYVPSAPYVDDSSVQPQDSTDQQNSDQQQDDDSNFDNQIWDFNK